MDDGQHFATHADIERMRADILQRIGELEVRLVERLAAVEVRLVERIEQNRAELIERMEKNRTELIERIAGVDVRVEQVEKRMLRWVGGLFIAQTFVLVGAVLGMIEVLR